MVKYLFAQLFLLIVFSLNATKSFASMAEVVWVESGVEVKSIHFGEYDEGEWAFNDEPLYVSGNPLTSLALGTDSRGQKILIWTELTRTKTVLMSMTANLDESSRLKWSSPILYSDYGKENFAASVVHDLNGDRWVFWAAATDSYSDIVVQRGFGDKPIKVNPSNEVPDTTPSAMITEQGNVQVRWNTFDFDADDYVSVTKDYSVETGTQTAPIKLIDSVSEKDIPLPSEVITDHSALLHFPSNQLVQSKTITNIQ